MREGWEYKKLGEVAAFYRGLTYTGKDEVDFSKNVVLRSNNVDLVRNTLNLNELKYISDEITIPKDKMVKKGSILMCMSNGSKQHIGKVAYINKDYNCAFGGFMGLIIPNENHIIPKLLYYYCCSCTFKQFVLSIVNGANINNLRFSDLSNKTVPIPFFSIQSVILSELDKITEMISKYDEQLKELDKLSQSIFYEMFGDPVENEKGWEVKIISDVSTYFNGVAHEQDIDDDGEFTLINSKFISTNGEVQKRTNKQRFPLLKNDLTMVLSDVPNGKALAKCYLVNEDNKYSLNQRICCFRGYEGAPLFFKYVVNRHQYFLSFNDGKGQTNLRKGDVEKMPIILPPLPLQQSFARKIEAIEAMKSKVKEAKKEAETLFAARMQYWFE